MPELKPAIMVAGCTRTGSTIIAKILALPPSVGYIEEPLNVQTGLVGTTQPLVYLYPGSVLESAYNRLIKDMLMGRANYKENALQPDTRNPLRMAYRRLFINRYHIRYKLDSFDPRVKRYIFKDPTASFSAQYLHQKYKTPVLITLRHPCAVVASHQRLGWTYSVADLLARPDLVKLFSSELKNCQPEKLNSLVELAWYWRAVYEVLEQFAQRNPEMVVVEHEHFSAQPLEVSQKLYQTFDLAWRADIERQVADMTGAQNPTDPTANAAHVLKRNSKANIKRWQKLLSAREQKQIMDICGPLYKRFQALPNNLKLSQ